MRKAVRTRVPSLPFTMPGLALADFDGNTPLLWVLYEEPMCATKPAAREITAKSRITPVATPNFPNRATTAPAALRVIARPAAASTAVERHSSARTFLPESSDSDRASSSSF